MNYKVAYSGSAAFIELPSGIDLKATFECGQAFRWKEVAPGAYEGVAGGQRARIARTETGITISPCDEAAFGFWRHYLDLEGDYRAWAKELSLDDTLRPMAERCVGMRVLNQPIWECLISFILSSNNNVKRISGIVERLCERYGLDRGGYFAFPTPHALAQAGAEGIAECGAGYRAEYVAEAARAVASGALDPESLPGVGYEAAKAALTKLKGVGEKVADCVLLYSCGYREAFPVDVWVRKAVTSYYPCAGKSARDIHAFADKRFGKLAGLAQQYLFYFERCLKED